MSGSPSRVYIARLAGLPVYDPNGDQVGKVRDVVVMLRQGNQPPRVLGLVVEVFTRRRIFLPMTRVTSVDAGHVITTGLVNMRRFEQRATEVLVLGELLDRTVVIRETGASAVVFDLAMEQWRTRDWVLTKVAVDRGREAVPAAWTVARAGLGGRQRSRAGRGRSGRDPHPRGLRVDEAGRPGRDPARPVSEAAQGDRVCAWTTSGWPTYWRSCPRTTRWRSWRVWIPSVRPTCWRRCHRTTPPT